MRKVILYSGHFGVGESTPSGLRVLGNAKALRAAGYEVVILGRSQEHGRGTADFLYQGFRCLCRGVHSSGRRLSRYWDCSDIIEACHKVGTKRIRAVITYHLPAIASVRLTKFCNSYGFLHLADTVEWYGPHQLKRGILGPAYYDSELRVRLANCRADGIIAVSSLLEDYYHRRGQLAIRIPPLVDLSEIKWKVSSLSDPESEIVKFLYAGTPGRKDSLPSIVYAFLRAADNGCNRFRFDVLGITQNAFLNDFPELRSPISRLSGSSCFWGRIEHKAVLEEVKRSDFTILARPNVRYANAGFPTKVVESLACGTPVVTNLTSDIGMYVHDRREGLVARSESDVDMADAIIRALMLSRDERRAMRESARQRAKDSFDYHNYISRFRDLLASDFGRG